jgi:putative ABC transport system substrate-binding protein
VTGLTGLTPELIAKRLQLLKEAVPGATRVAILRLPGRLQAAMVKDLTTAGRQLGIELLVLEVQSADDLPSAFAQAANRRVDAVMTTQAPFFAFEATRIAEFALKHRLPGLSGESGAPAAGMLMFYGSNTARNCGRAAVYVDKILKGAKPADLPVEQPTQFELVINLKTAKALALTIPRSLLLRADEVIR